MKRKITNTKTINDDTTPAVDIQTTLLVVFMHVLAFDFSGAHGPSAFPPGAFPEHGGQGDGGAGGDGGPENGGGGGGVVGDVGEGNRAIVVLLNGFPSFLQDKNKIRIYEYKITNLD